MFIFPLETFANQDWGGLIPSHVPFPHLVTDFGTLPVVTIHLYYDGNCRTARLLATFILHKGGLWQRSLRPSGSGPKSALRMDGMR
jgi:hypothetical protein